MTTCALHPGKVCLWSGEAGCSHSPSTPPRHVWIVQIKHAGLPTASTRRKTKVKSAVPKRNLWFYQLC